MPSVLIDASIPRACICAAWRAGSCAPHARQVSQVGIRLPARELHPPDDDRIDHGQHERRVEATARGRSPRRRCRPDRAGDSQATSLECLRRSRQRCSMLTGALTSPTDSRQWPRAYLPKQRRYAVDRSRHREVCHASAPSRYIRMLIWTVRSSSDRAENEVVGARPTGECRGFVRRRAARVRVRIRAQVAPHRPRVGYNDPRNAVQRRREQVGNRLLPLRGDGIGCVEWKHGDAESCRAARAARRAAEPRKDHCVNAATAATTIPMTKRAALYGRQRG